VFYEDFGCPDGIHPGAKLEEWVKDARDIVLPSILIVLTWAETDVRRTQAVNIPSTVA
jgi:hypothetical protein